MRTLSLTANSNSVRDASCGRGYFLYLLKLGVRTLRLAKRLNLATVAADAVNYIKNRAIYGFFRDNGRGTGAIARDNKSPDFEGIRFSLSLGQRRNIARLSRVLRPSGKRYAVAARRAADRREIYRTLYILMRAFAFRTMATV